MPADVNKCQQITTMLMFFGVLHVAPQAKRITQRGAKPDGQSANHAVPDWPGHVYPPKTPQTPTNPHGGFAEKCRTNGQKP